MFKTILKISLKIKRAIDEDTNRINILTNNHILEIL